MTEPSLSRRAAALGLVLVAVASLGFASRFVHDPLMAGEVYLVIAADHLAREGRPMTRTKADAARFAAFGRASEPSADARDTGYTLWRPPLYIRLAAVVFGLAGTGAAQARLVGLGCLLATILATYVLSQAVFRAYGLPTNTIEQLLFLEHDPRVVAALRESFRRWTIGSYTVWVRRP